MPASEQKATEQKKPPGIFISYRRSDNPEWFSRSGALLGAVGDPDSSYGRPRVSPDGRRIAVDRSVGGDQDLWVFDGPRLSRLTFDPSPQIGPLWFPDGRNIAYTSATGRVDIYRRSANGIGAAVRLTDADGYEFPVSISPDGRYLLYNIGSSSVVSDLFLQPLDGKRGPLPWLQTPFSELSGSFSPDGRWIAYASNASGRWEVYVRPFSPPGVPNEGTPATEAQWTVSASGGSSPAWRPDGREIFFLSPRGEMMAAPVSVSGLSLSPGTPVRLFATRILGGGRLNNQWREYDLAPDGRFLINTELDAGVTPPIILIQNWNPKAKK